MLRKILAAIARTFRNIDFYLRGIDLIIQCILALAIAGAFLAAGVFVLMKAFTS
ncbi:MAG: hypothetical protein IJS39_05925 [Synergistaceae bacterium]|nr:hypothetical protein [Synergistaceae bacterium]